MAQQAASLHEKAENRTQPKRKYHDSNVDVKGYLLIYLILYIPRTIKYWHAGL